MIDTESYPGAWEEAFARGCLSETVTRCKACEESLCQHPDPVFAGIVPPSDGLRTSVAPSRAAVEVGRAGLSHPTPPEAR